MKPLPRKQTDAESGSDESQSSDDGRKLFSLLSTDWQNFHANLADWISAQHIFITGSFARAALRPADAQSISINTHPGWMSQQNGLTVVVVQPARDSTFFFAGTGSPGQVEQLAAQAQTHLSD
jgi:hypothetical protein